MGTLSGTHVGTPAGHPQNEGNLTPDLLDPNQIRQLLRHIFLTMLKQVPFIWEG